LIKTEPSEKKTIQAVAVTVIGHRRAMSPFAEGSINLLAPELFFLILAHTVYKMWIIQEPNTLEL